MKLVALIAAHNEESTIRSTLLSLLAQERTLDRIVVAVDNCTDGTLAAVRSVHGVVAFETRDNTAKKPGALNQAWRRHCRDADLIVCLDADTTLVPTAVGDWEREFVENPLLGGCSAKFTMLVSEEMDFKERLLVRLQRAEFAKWTDVALQRGRRTSVLAGTACCIRNQALREVLDLRGNEAAAGPWIETSMVEDFELTYRMRSLGWETKVSATVRAYTDAMTDLRSLWAQRMKWQTGTVRDLTQFGVNRLTRYDWWQQAQGLLSLIARTLWVTLLVATIAMGHFQLQPLWIVAPVLFLLNDVKQAFRIPDRRPADILTAAAMIPQEFFAFMRAGWFTLSWSRFLDDWAFGRDPTDHWSLQAEAESRRRTATPALPLAS